MVDVSETLPAQDLAFRCNDGEVFVEGGDLGDIEPPNKGDRGSVGEAKPLLRKLVDQRQPDGPVLEFRPEQGSDPAVNEPPTKVGGLLRLRPASQEGDRLRKDEIRRDKGPITISFVDSDRSGMQGVGFVYERHPIARVRIHGAHGYSGP